MPPKKRKVAGKANVEQASQVKATRAAQAQPDEDEEQDDPTPAEPMQDAGGADTDAAEAMISEPLPPAELQARLCPHCACTT